LHIEAAEFFYDKPVANASAASLPRHPFPRGVALPR